VLAVLFCLMGCVAGFTRAGVLSALTDRLIRCADTTRRMSLMLVFLCFVLAMFVTNDVALVAIVPITVAVFAQADAGALIRTLVLETVAANLGGILLPTGNPQNLYLFSHYQMSFDRFILTVLPCWTVSAVLLAAATLLQKSAPLPSVPTQTAAVKGGLRPWMHAALFVLSLLAVLDVVPYWICLAVSVVCFVCFDRPVFGGVDYALLLTFVAFFIFVGNLARIDAVQQTAAALLQGRELLAGIAVSQVCSNVPAAMMLSGFTQNAEPLLLGVNIGGLGTIIASMASLITYGLYAKTPNAKKGRFMGIFTAYNLAFLVLLTAFSLIFA